MKAKSKIILLMVILVWALSTSLVLAQLPDQERFIYDSRNKRDPFISLLDSNSPTGLRTVFTRPGEQVTLPVEIKLSGILWNGKEYFAIINEEVLKKGQYVEKVKIAEIEKDRVIVEYLGQNFAVPLRKEKK